jgi:hypothetical protein
MNGIKRNPEKEPVVAVCGKDAFTYGPIEPNGIRPLIRKQTFQHHGAAILFAQEFEEPFIAKHPA